MTNSELTRGNEIIGEISDLKQAILSLNIDNFFNVKRSCMNSDSDVTLSSINIQMKSFGVNKIVERINYLQQELASIGSPSVSIDDLNKTVKGKNHD